MVSSPAAASSSSVAGVLPTRQVLQQDALKYLESFERSGPPHRTHVCFMTSLPDITETMGEDGLPAKSREVWEDFFIGAAEAIFRAMPNQSLAIFYQTHTRMQSADTELDKSFLIKLAARTYNTEKRYTAHQSEATVAVPVVLAWHKVCSFSDKHEKFENNPELQPRAAVPLKKCSGLVNFSHLLCFRKGQPPPSAWNFFVNREFVPTFPSVSSASSKSARERAARERTLARVKERNGSPQKESEKASPDEKSCASSARSTQAGTPLDSPKIEGTPEETSCELDSEEVLNSNSEDKGEKPSTSTPVNHTARTDFMRFRKKNIFANLFAARDDAGFVKTEKTGAKTRGGNEAVSSADHLVDLVDPKFLRFARAARAAKRGETVKMVPNRKGNSSSTVSTPQSRRASVTSPHLHNIHRASPPRATPGGGVGRGGSSSKPSDNHHSNKTDLAWFQSQWWTATTPCDPMKPWREACLPDIVPKGTLIKNLRNRKRSMGVGVTLSLVQWVQKNFDVDLIIDPFCGAGTVLAAANLCCIDSVGVDVSVRRVKQARELQFGENSCEEYVLIGE